MQPSTELYRAIFDSAAQGVLVVDTRGRILMANGALEALFGYGAGEMHGLRIEDLVPAGKRGAHKAHRDGFFEHPRQRPMGGNQELDAVRRDGTLFSVEVSLGYSGSGAEMLGIGFVVDITARRNLERANRRGEERLRALTAQLLTAQEDERRRIARELHDGLTQDLASVGIELGLLRREASGGLAEQLASLQRNVSDLSDQVRQLAHEFHPGVLEHSGLGTALQSYCQELERITGLPIRFTARDVPEGVPKAIASTLYRITQEALRNVVKHAQASNASVLLTGMQDGDGTARVRLTVMDNGQGFLIEEVRDGSGLGLMSIEERARTVQGRLTIGSVPGEGTSVSVEVPIPPEEQ
jgi:PAS domain S-box-containing protein